MYAAGVRYHAWRSLPRLRLFLQQRVNIATTCVYHVSRDKEARDPSLLGISRASCRFEAVSARWCKQ